MDEGIQKRTLIVLTAHPGRAHQVLADFLDAIYHLDPSPSARPTEFRGVFLVETRATPEQIKRTVNCMYIRNLTSLRFVVVYNRFSSEEKLPEIARELASRYRELTGRRKVRRIDVYARGVRVSSDEVRRAVAAELEVAREEGLRVSVEVIGDIIGIAEVYRPFYLSEASIE